VCVTLSTKRRPNRAGCTAGAVLGLRLLVFRGGRRSAGFPTERTKLLEVSAPPFFKGARPRRKGVFVVSSILAKLDRVWPEKKEAGPIRRRT